MDWCDVSRWFYCIGEYCLMEVYTYKTITTASEGTFTDKGSKFIGYIFPIESETDFKEQLKNIKSLHSGARHFCYALRLGVQSITDKSNDDGEPSGTAGKPILNQLISAGITQVGLIVVRYFGGTLLGTSGLIQAYKQGAIEAIKNTNIIEKPVTKTIQLTVPYSTYNDFMNVIKKWNINYIPLHSTNSSSVFEAIIPIHLIETFITEVKPYIEHEE